MRDKCIIFCSAEIKDYDFLKKYNFNEYYIICADGGLKHAESLGIFPDLWIGDNDSLNSEKIAAAEVKRFSSDKDKTDTEIAIDEAIARGFKKAIIIGGLGGRIDHEFSHFCLLKYALLQGLECKIVNAKNEIMMTCGSMCILRSEKKYVSFFPFGDRVTGLTIKGLKYSLENAVLNIEDVRASSNEFDENSDKAFVSVKSGYLLVILAED